MILFVCCKVDNETNWSKKKQTTSNSQSKSKYEFQVEDACGFDKSMVNETVYSFDSDIEAETALKKIMRLTGLPANFEIRAASVPNAAAVIKCDKNGTNCNRYILYNQEFMEKVEDETKTNYAELAILAHEIAHHLSGHTITNTGSSYDMELEADKFAGFMLYKMGASITETKQSFSNLPLQGTSSHPPRSARIAAVTNGWYDAKRNGEKVMTKSENKGTSSQSKSNASKTNKKTKRIKMRIGQQYEGGLVFDNNNNKIGVFIDFREEMTYNEAKSKEINGWRIASQDEIYRMRRLEWDNLFYFSSGYYWSRHVPGYEKVVLFDFRKNMNGVAKMDGQYKNKLILVKYYNVNYH